MSISLKLARHREEIRLTALVAEIALEQGYDVNDRPHRAKVADGAQLRGIPAIGPRSAGSAVAGTQPGTDEHLERLG